METHRIQNVEILAEGEWTSAQGNKVVVTEERMHELVRNRDLAGFEPPIKGGHTEDKGDVALGWAENLRVVGKSPNAKLVADFEKVPTVVRDYMASGRVGHVSIEFFQDFKRGAEKLKGWVMKAVALLGAEMPAAKGLTPLHKMELTQGVDYSALEEFKVEFTAPKTEPSPEEDMETIKELQDKLAAQETAHKEALGKVTKERDDLQAKVDEFEGAKPKPLTENEKVMKAELAELKEENRVQRVTSLTGKLKVPAFRGMLEAFCELASKSDLDVVEFSDGDTKVKESPMDAAEKFVEKINGMTATLFEEATASESEKEAGSEDAKDYSEASRKIKELAEAHLQEQGWGEDRMSQAITFVMEKHPQLAAKYNS